MRWKTVLVFVAAALLVLGGCGDDDASPPDTAPATSAPSGDATDDGVDDATDDGVDDAADPAPVVVPIDVDPCTLVTADEVAAAIGVDVADGAFEPPIACSFDVGPGAGVQLLVVVDDGEGRFIAPSRLFVEYLALVPDGEAEMIDGLGERAVYSSAFRGLAVDAGGGRFVAVVVNGGYAELAAPRDEFVAVARLVLPRL